MICPMFTTSTCRTSCPWYSGHCRTEFILAVNAARLAEIRETIERTEKIIQTLRGDVSYDA